MLDISKVISSYRAGLTTPTQSVSALLDAIAASGLNTFISVDQDSAMAAAGHSDRVLEKGGTLGRLHGVPIAIKDLIDVAGMRTTMGSEQYVDNLATQDAVVVGRLRAAGAIIVGKTNTHQFAYGPTGDRSHFGAVRNPWDPSRVSGGSSSGSAAALAAGLCAGALGTDTSGSVRLPAALCGVVGLKPTYDLLPRDGVFALTHTLDHVGPMTTTVADNALLLEILADQEFAYTHRIGKSIAGLTVGVPMDFFGAFLSAGVRTAVEQAKEAFLAAGARLVQVNIAGIDEIYDAQQLVLKVEAYAQHREALSAGLPYLPEVRTRLMSGSDIASADYLQALAKRESARRAFDHVLEQVDVLMAPTCGITAPPLDARRTIVDGQDYSAFWLLTRLTAPTNFSGHPSLSVPFGSENGLPVGMQLIGRYHDEATLYQFARVLETTGTRGTAA